MKGISKALLTALLISNFITVPCTAASDHSVQESFVSTAKMSRPRIALALGGGGVRGAAHIGVLRVLQREGIPFDYVVGNSMGAVVGGLHCAGVPLDKIQSVLADGSLVSAYLPHFLWCRILISPFRKVYYLGRQRPYAGLVSGDKLKAVIDRLLVNPDIKVEDLKIPFSSIAVNLLDGQAHMLSEGRLDDILRASATIPLLLRPVPIAGNLYVDGGVRNNLPTDEARRSGADIVISVEIDNDMKPVPARQFSSFRMVFDRVMNATLEQLDEDKVHGADIVIRPELVNIPILSKDKRYVNEAVMAGESAALKVLPRIRERLHQSGISTN